MTRRKPHNILGRHEVRMTRPFTLHQGDCLEVLRTFPDNSIDSIVTDPPYGLSKEPDMAEVLRHWLAGDDYQHKGGGFMGKSWDSFVPGPSVWKECLRVLKPGGHLLAFFGTRTQDMGTLAIRLAGFEIRDSIVWVYGSGFPKSMDVSKAIDKAAGAAREAVGVSPNWRESKRDREKDGSMEVRGENDGLLMGPPVTDAARRWEGWGTALKPAHEPITFARKPLAKGHTVAANVLAHGTGALNIDGCRVRPGERVPGGGNGRANHGGQFAGEYRGERPIVEAHTAGRWPANLIYDGSDEVVALFPVTGKSAGGGKSNGDKFGGGYAPSGQDVIGYADTGSAARFFYCAKASRKDRNEGLDNPGAQFKRGTTLRKVENTATKGNNHPTVKPTTLMAYLCRLVTPPGGVVLDPFMGSGSTGKAAVREGFVFVGIERDQDENGEPLGYLAISEARITFEWKRAQGMPDRIEASNSASDCQTSGQADLFAEAPA